MALLNSCIASLEIANFIRVIVIFSSPKKPAHLGQAPAFF